MTRRSLVRGLSGLGASILLPSTHAEDTPSILRVGGGTIEVNFRSNEFDLPRQAMLDWITVGARAVTNYFGRFPVPHARLEIVMASGRRGGRVNGVTFGEGGAHSRLTVAQHVTVQDLEADWVLTHELVHYGFPNMQEEHHWIEEGSATYIEPIARAAVGNLPVTAVWGDMIRLMPQGLPTDGDQGLDHTHTWGRTYWGGALYCLLADVAIRQKSHNRKGLVDALRAINRAGGTIESDWPLERTLQMGDKATGGKELMNLYGQMASKSMPVDLPALWKQLGVRREGRDVMFDNDAPLAAVRTAIAS